MYLISVEGGDGSGKGEAVRLLAEIAATFPFTKIHVTHEPRRHSELGKIALAAVKTESLSPLREAGLFAADRVDHSHTWIKPKLLRGELVISDRNVHSSLVYQGIVGGLGVECVAQMNSAAMRPDLVIWIDCDPKKAMKRIKTGTLRISGSGKQEYFETTELQIKIRKGFNNLFTGKISVPQPFNKCCVIGPILNEGGLDELERQLKETLREFMNRRPDPLNCISDEVDIHLLARLAQGVQAQMRLPGGPPTNSSLLENWLVGKSPAQLMQQAEDDWPIESAMRADVPTNVLSRSSWAVIGTLSLMDTTDVPTLHQKLGPVRMVTKRHTQRLIKWMESEGWIHKQQNHIPFREAQLFKLKNSRTGYARLSLVMWPLRAALASWRRSNPKADWVSALQDIAGENSTMSSKGIAQAISSIISRLELISSGHKDCPCPSDITELITWWSTPPP